MPVYEYELLHLRQVRERDYQWDSTHRGLIGHHDKLHPFLNERGQDGWSIVTHVSDGRFGNMIVLQRPIPEAKSEAVAVQKEMVTTPFESDLIVTEVGRLRADLQQGLALQAQLLTTLGKEFPAVLQAVSQSVGELAARPLPVPVPVPVQATVDGIALRQLGGQLEAAIDNLRFALQPAPPVEPERLVSVSAPAKDWRFWKQWRAAPLSEGVA